jgi:hypothetical protein
MDITAPTLPGKLQLLADRLVLLIPYAGHHNIPIAELLEVRLTQQPHSCQYNWKPKQGADQLATQHRIPMQQAYKTVAVLEILLHSLKGTAASVYRAELNPSVQKM